MNAAESWAQALAEWAIPAEILSVAPEPPWSFPAEVLAEGTRRALNAGLTPTHQRVVEALLPGGALLDVGCGTGSASLPALRATRPERLVAVDQDPHMLETFALLAAAPGPGAATGVAIGGTAGMAVDEAGVGTAGARADGPGLDLIEGQWPDVASRVGTADVAVCANVAYNVADLGRFVEALTAVTSRRVVLELSALHPQSPLSPLWEHFWGLSRPGRPTAADAEAVITEVLGLVPASQRWTSERPFMGDPGPAAMALVRRRLCLPESSDREVAETLDRLPRQPAFSMVTLWWPGRAPLWGPPP